MTSLGIDIGGTSVKVALLRDQQVAWTGQSSTYSRPTTAQIVAAVGEAVGGREIRAERVGLCCPGLMDRSTRTITLSVNLPGLIGVTLDHIVERALGERLPLPEILSDANAVGFDVYAEHRLNGRLLCISIGTGVGASVVDEGSFLHVSGESPGHLGQMDVSLDDSPPVGSDGGLGSLEAYIGAEALRRCYGDGHALDRMKIQDPPLRALVRALRIAQAIYRPQHVCLTGGIGTRLRPLVPALKAATEDRLSSVARRDWTLFTGDHDFHAARGVARWAVSRSAAIGK